MRQVKPFRTAKLSDEEVIDLRMRLEDGETTRMQEADRFNVAPETIAKIARYQTYRHVGKMAPGIEAKLPDTPLTQEQQDDFQSIIKRQMAKGLITIAPSADAMIRELVAPPAPPTPPSLSSEELRKFLANPTFSAKVDDTEATDSPNNPMEE